MNTNATDHAPIRAAIARHFTARAHPEDEQTMRQHLPTCADCHALYERHRLMSLLDPQAPDRQARLGHGLGIVASRRTRGWGWAAAFACVATAIVLMVPRWGSVEAQFASRGRNAALPALPAAELQIFAAHPGTAPRRIASVTTGETGAAGPVSVRATDELAMAYRNTAGKKRLLIFGVDSDARVYWYHPAWSDAAAPPRALAIAGGPALTELPEAIAHPLREGPLQVKALFTDRDLNVRDVEAALANGGRIAQDDDIELSMQVHVTP